MGSGEYMIEFHQKLWLLGQQNREREGKGLQEDFTQPQFCDVSVSRMWATMELATEAEVNKITHRAHSVCLLIGVGEVPRHELMSASSFSLCKKLALL